MGIGLILLSVLVIKCGKKKEIIQPSQMVPLHPALVMKPVPEGLGVNIHFYDGNPNDWKMLSEAGVGIVRMDVSWAGAEKVPGQYDFSRYDTLVTRLGKNHMRLLFILDYGNPLYDTGLPPHSDSALVASARFCSALANRYKGKSIIWELWNEPNLQTFWRPEPNAHQYVTWARAVTKAIRQTDPKACIIGPAVSRIDLGFLQSVFKLGYLELVDGVSVHPYRSPKRGPETAIPEYEMLRTLIEQFKPAGKTVPIISGEWGYSTINTPPDLQGKYLVRQWLNNLSLGIPISIWYDWHDDGQDPNNSEHHFGTVAWNYSPKPAFLAMKTLIDELGGFRPAERIGFGNTRDFMVPFFKGKTVKLAVWTTDLPHRINLGDDMKIAQAVNFQGKRRQFWGLPKVPLRNAPLYLTLSQPVPNWLKLDVHEARIGDAERSDVVETIMSHKEPQTDFGKIFFRSFRDGSVKEHRAALHVLTCIADHLKNRNKAVTLYRFVLNQDADILDVQNAIYGLAARQVTENMAEISNAETNPDLHQPVALYRLKQAEAFLKNGQFKACRKAIFPILKGSDFVDFVNELVDQLENRNALSKDSIAQLAEKAGFVNRWWVAGPFPGTGKEAQKVIYFPEKKIDFSETMVFEKDTVRWQKITVKNVWGTILFDNLFGKIPGTAYAYAELKVPRKRNALFKIGSNDAVVCWLNGRKIHQNWVGRGLTVDEDRVPVHLKRGTNRILLKVVNYGARWSSCLRVCDAAGNPLDVRELVSTPGFKK